MAFNIRKFKFRVQVRPASKTKGRRVSLVAQRRVVNKAEKVTSGTKEKGGLR